MSLPVVIARPTLRVAPSAHSRQMRCRRLKRVCRASSESNDDLTPALSAEALGALSQSGCCGGSQPEVSARVEAPATSAGGCGCSGGSAGAATRKQEESAAQGVIQAFSNMLGGPDGRLSREDLAAALSTPLGEPRQDGASGERFWDVQDVLAGLPADLVFEYDGDEELDGLVV